MGRMSIYQLVVPTRVHRNCQPTFQYYASATSYARNLKRTYRVVEVVLLRAFLLVPLDDTELGLILRILHHMPVECLNMSSTLYTIVSTYLLILSVDTSSFDQFRLELLDGVLQVSYSIESIERRHTGLDWRCTTIV
jgi:hypothetical protein